MAVRKVSNRGRNIIGHFPSLKLQRMVAFESLLERDFICVLDYEPAVTWFAEQPVVIHYEHDGKSRHYTPDFHVIYREHHLLFECKPVHFVSKPENQIKFEAARLWCQAQGWLFRVVTDAQLNSNWRVTNIKRLTQCARYVIPPALKGGVFAFLNAAIGPVQVSDVMQAVNPEQPQMALIPILHMAFHHEVHIPLDEAAITVHSPIALTNPLEETRELLP